MLGVVYEVQVAKLVPPVEAAYQFMVPALAAAPKVTVPLPQRLAGVVPLILGIALTVINKALLVAVVVDKQVALEVKIT